jgi:hypothetical protein
MPTPTLTDPLVLALVCWSSDDPTLAALGRVSRLAHAHAMASLWHTMSSPRPLLSLLKRHAALALHPACHAPVPASQDRHELTREWTRFATYAHLVRRVRWHETPQSAAQIETFVAISAFVHRARPDPSVALLPRLDAADLECITARTLAGISYWLRPGMVHLRVRLAGSVDGEAVARFLAVVEDGGCLQSLSFAWDAPAGERRQIAAALASLLERNGKLRTVDVGDLKVALHEANMDRMARNFANAVHVGDNASS